MQMQRNRKKQVPGAAYFKFIFYLQLTCTITVVPAVGHSDSTRACLTRRRPPLDQRPPGSTRSYDDIIDYIPCAGRYVPPTIFIIGNLYFLTPFTFLPVSPNPLPPDDPLKRVSVSVSLFPVCFVLFVHLCCF